MARYRMSDGTVIDTKRSSAFWDEVRYSDGSNLVGKSSGSQWDYEILYRSRRGRFYIEHTSCMQGKLSRCEWVSNEEACRWLLTNDYDVRDDDFPVDLKDLVDEIVE